VYGDSKQDLRICIVSHGGMINMLFRSFIRGKTLLLLIVLCVFLFGCKSQGVSMKETSIDRVKLISYGYSIGQSNVDAMVTDSDDIKKIQNILKSFTKLDGLLADRMGAVHYEIILEQSDRKGVIKNETYPIYQLTKEDYIMESGDKVIYEYEDKDMELSGLFEKYLKCKSPFETN
jgi:hypothetical protein